MSVLWVSVALALVPCSGMMFAHFYRLMECCWAKDPEVRELERIWRRS